MPVTRSEQGLSGPDSIVQPSPSAERRERLAREGEELTPAAESVDGELDGEEAVRAKVEDFVEAVGKGGAPPSSEQISAWRSALVQCEKLHLCELIDELQLEVSLNTAIASSVEVLVDLLLEHEVAKRPPPPPDEAEETKALLRAILEKQAEKSLSFKFRVAKGSTKHKHNLSFHWPPESIPALIAAMESYAQLRARLGCTHDQYWRLPWEAKKLVSADFGKMLARSLARRGLSAPKGFVYSMHSVRAGAQSAAAAIGVTVVTIRHQGGYVPGSNVPEQKYIDPSCPPSPAAVLFFGWLRPSPSS